MKTADQAITIALVYLSQQPFVKEYLVDTAEATEREESWYVKINHVDGRGRRPSVGVISVSKATGKASWPPPK